MRLRIEVKVDDQLIEGYEFETGGDSVSRFWRFVREFQLSMTKWSYSKFFGE